jgi:hypothetical protein
MPVNAAELQWYLEGISFPATKDEVVNLARDNNATDETLVLLEGLPDREYTSPDDVIYAAGVSDEGE